MELYKKHRPYLLKHIQGQESAVKQLKGFFKENTFPHAVLITGPSGCGKTTLARIIKSKLDCSDDDFIEMNSADDRGVEAIRGIKTRWTMSMRGQGKCRIYFMDECHQLTKDAQTALLKSLEDQPSYVYFILATTDGTKMIPTVKTRCTEIKLELLSNDDLQHTLAYVLERENVQISQDVIDRIIDVAEGSARKALVILDQIALLETEEEQIEAVQKSETRAQAIELARALISPRPVWKNIAKILKDLSDDPEGIRHLVLAYSKNVLLGGGKLSNRAYLLINCFRDNFYDSKHAGLVAACWEATITK